MDYFSGNFYFAIATAPNAKKPYLVCCMSNNLAAYSPGNVRAIITDRKVASFQHPQSGNWNITGFTADITSAQDYYPGGMLMPGRQYNSDSYRYGFNTQEKVDEIKGSGNHLTAKYWEYDPRIGRRWNMDPVYTASESRYAVNGNNPIYFNDPNGDFKTKFGAWVHKLFKGGDEILRDKESGEWFVGRNVEFTGKGAGVAYQRTFNSKIGSTGEFLRGGVGAALNFKNFLFGGGGHTTYREGDFEADMMATSPGVRKGVEKLISQMQQGEASTKFSYSFSPSPTNVLNKTLETGNPLNGFSEENKEAHVDVFNTMSFTKLYVGGYVGTLRLIDENTVKVTIFNATTANSLLLHSGELIFGEEKGAQRFNDLWNKTPFLNTQTQRFEFTIPLKK